MLLLNLHRLYGVLTHLAPSTEWLIMLMCLNLPLGMTRRKLGVPLWLYDGFDC